MASDDDEFSDLHLNNHDKCICGLSIMAGFRLVAAYICLYSVATVVDSYFALGVGRKYGLPYALAATAIGLILLLLLVKLIQKPSKQAVKFVRLAFIILQTFQLIWHTFIYYYVAHLQQTKINLEPCVFVTAASFVWFLVQGSGVLD